MTCQIHICYEAHERKYNIVDVARGTLYNIRKKARVEFLEKPLDNQIAPRHRLASLALPELTRDFSQTVKYDLCN